MVVVVRWGRSARWRWLFMWWRTRKARFPSRAPFPVPRSFPLCYLDPLAILPGSLNLPPSLSPRSCSVSVVWGGGDGSVLEVENHWRLKQLMVFDALPFP